MILISITTIAQEPDLSNYPYESAIFKNSSSAFKNPLWIALAGFRGNSSSLTIWINKGYLEEMFTIHVGIV